MTARLIIGDVFDALATIPDGSVDCVVTSPPYLGQRSYLPAGHPLKAKEIGQEATPGEGVEVLLAVMDEIWRVLTPAGTYWVNLGDIHAGSGGSGGDYMPGGWREDQPRSEGSAAKARRLAKLERRPDAAAFQGGPIKDRQVDTALGILPVRHRTRRHVDGWPVDQSIAGLGYLFGMSLAYGRNLLTGVEHETWVVRPFITWCKPNPTPGRDGRRFRTGTEVVVYGGKSQSHYWGGDELRTAPQESSRTHFRSTEPTGYEGHANSRQTNRRANPLGVPLLNWWEISPAQFSGSHYAVMPEELVRRCVIAGCPPKGVVLDPFAGTGTSLLVATRHGRGAVGIDIDERNAVFVQNRVGLSLSEVEQLTDQAAV